LWGYKLNVHPRKVTVKFKIIGYKVSKCCSDKENVHVVPNNCLLGSEKFIAQKNYSQD
jgi:hypothetical protein